MGQNHYDVIIVGAGPSGSAAARALTAGGMRALLLDKKNFPRLKLCAGWLPPSVFSLLGISWEQYPFAIRRYENVKVCYDSVRYTLKAEQYSIVRTEFDHWLLRESKTPFVQEAVRSIQKRENGFLLNNKYSCQYLIGAGGTACPVRQFLRKNLLHDLPASADEKARRRRNIATRELEFEGLALSEMIHLFWWKDFTGYGWFVPKPGKINMGVGGLREKTGNIELWWRRLLDQTLSLKLIAKPEAVEQMRPGAHTYYLNHRRSHRRLVSAMPGNLFLIGDSLGLATLDLGEGIGPAIESGQMAAKAILENKPYEPQRIRLYSNPWSRFLQYLPYAPVMKI